MLKIRYSLSIPQQGYKEIQEATNDHAPQHWDISNLFDSLNEEFKSAANPTHLGTLRDRLIKRMTGNPDTYSESRQFNNRKALDILTLAKRRKADFLHA